MKKENVIRSPLFYTGDKYKLIPELKKYFPTDINKFVEPFVGGGSVFLNIQAKQFYENDIDKNIKRLTNQLWKLIPMRENNEDWRKQLDTVTLEVVGLNEIFLSYPQFL